MWAATTTTVFFVTWEQWFVGSFDLPPINGANEGNVVVASVFLWTALMGQDWWGEPVIDGWSRAEAIVVAYASSAVLTMLGNVVNLINAVHSLNAGTHRYPTASLRQAATLHVALTRPLATLMLVCGGWAWAQRSPSGVLQSHPHMFFAALGLLVTKGTVSQMVSHLCDDSFRPCCKALAVAGALAAHALLGPELLGTSVDSEAVLVYKLLAVGAVALLHQTVMLTREISGLLGINVLIVPRHVREKTE